MQRRDEAENGKKGGGLKERLSGVRKRKQNLRGSAGVNPFACSRVASKMELVEGRRKRDDGRS
jgi:hypothetical protein